MKYSIKFNTKGCEQKSIQCILMSYTVRFEEKWIWTSLRFYTGIFQEELSKITKDPCQDNQPSGQECNFQNLKPVRVLSTWLATFNMSSIKDCTLGQIFYHSILVWFSTSGPYSYVTPLPSTLCNLNNWLHLITATHTDNLLLFIQEYVVCSNSFWLEFISP
jgi:hypothetical protein